MAVYRVIKDSHLNIKGCFLKLLSYPAFVFYYPHRLTIANFANEAICSQMVVEVYRGRRMDMGIQIAGKMCIHVVE